LYRKHNPEAQPRQDSEWTTLRKIVEVMLDDSAARGCFEPELVDRAIELVKRHSMKRRHR
jgi:hypothetical protein